MTEPPFLQFPETVFFSFSAFNIHFSTVYDLGILEDHLGFLYHAPLPSETSPAVSLTPIFLLTV